MLGSEDPVRRLSPDGRALAGLLADIGANCFAVTGTRYTTHMFGPGLGIYEDPATGSGVGPLAAWRGMGASLSASRSRFPGRRAGAAVDPVRAGYGRPRSDRRRRGWRLGAVGGAGRVPPPVTAEATR